MKYWRKDIDKVRTEYSDRDLSHFHSVHHKTHMEFPGIEPGPP